MPAPRVDLQAQVACVERELRYREHVYARRVSEGKMTAAKARDEIAAMRAVLATVQEAASREKLF